MKKNIINQIKRVAIGLLLVALGAGGALAFQYYFDSSKVDGKGNGGENNKSEYVYVDRNDIIHTDRKCSRLNYKGMRSTRHRISGFWISQYNSFCPKCVSDEEYERLKSECK